MAKLEIELNIVDFEFMDEIFGEDNFVREIIWRIGLVSGFKSVANNWVRNHDTLLYYAKNKIRLSSIKYILRTPQITKDGVGDLKGRVSQ